MWGLVALSLLLIVIGLLEMRRSRDVHDVYLLGRMALFLGAMFLFISLLAAFHSKGS